MKTKKCRWSIHKFVALAFLGEVPKDKEIDHIDGDKLNNHYLNLRYVTHQENCNSRDERNGVVAEWKRKIFAKMKSHKIPDEVIGDCLELKDWEKKVLGE